MSIATQISRLTTLRNNIRTKLNALGIIVKRKNICNPSDITIGGFVRASNSASEPRGFVVENASWSCSGYIYVYPNTQYTSSVPSYGTSSVAGLVFFSNTDASSSISAVSANDQGSYTYTFTTPADCHYIRISWKSRNFISENTNYPLPQVEKGASATTYEAFYSATPGANGDLEDCYSAIVNGIVASKSAATITPTTTAQTISAGQYLSGAQTIAGDANLVAGNIAQGVSIFGVQGSHVGGLDISVTRVSDGQGHYKLQITNN